MTDTQTSKKTHSTLHIRPPRKWVPVDLRELWEYRELLYSFVSRDVKIRYKQTALGFLWAIIQPLLTMIIFTLIFGGFAKIPSDNVPYPLFSFAALIPWTLFSEGLTRSTTSMVTNANIMTKVYFPRLVMPISGVLSPLVDFFIAFIILILLMAHYGFVPTMTIVLLPFFILLAITASLSVGLWLSALNVKYRDFQYTLPFIIQLGLYASPVVYPSSMIPEQYRIFYGLNPMVGVIEGFRWALLGTKPPEAMILISVGVVIVLLVGGLFYFKRMEQYFADVV
jgi:lipopolysaccharide transport system permease protein